MTPGHLRLLGCALLACGILFHESVLEHFLSRDQQFETLRVRGSVWLLQLSTVVCGFLLLANRPRRLPEQIRRVSVLRLLPALGLFAVAVGVGANAVVAVDAWERRVTEKSTQELVRSEELLLDLQDAVAKVELSLLNLQLPDRHSLNLFAPAVELVELGPPDQEPSGVFGRQVWSPNDAAIEVDRDQLRIWRRLLDRVEFVDHAQISLVRGRFGEGASDSWTSDASVELLARMQDGSWAGVKAAVVIDWKIEDEHWRVTSWRTTSFSTTRAAVPLFEDVLRSAIPRLDERREAAVSPHERLIVDYATSRGEIKPHEQFQYMSADRHPGLSVVDIDDDGFDDLYVMLRWGRNQLWRNLGNGQFEEQAASWGLDVEDHTSSAIFADFDNDGDVDAFLGRTLARSLYLRNEDGRFVDRSADLVKSALPFFASSVAAADFDDNGLLDLYVSTYAFEAVARLLSDRLEGSFFSEEEERRLRKLGSRPDRFLLDAFGPQNILLRNVGDGRFELATDVPELFVNRNSYQATWADYDLDGDPDLYLANDYAPNNLFRNDGGRFVDVTDETGTADVGFGMGVAWGDYDGDGRQDLYVTNMYSKAGQRVTGAFEEVDGRFVRAASGNSLFRQRESTFERVSGTESLELQVTKAGWAWSGQFVDVENDGDLDLLSLSGNYTPPREIALSGDL